MWARDMELMLGLWLLASPFVFAHRADAPHLWAHDLALGAAIAAIALAAHWTPLRRLHLLLLPVATWLIAFGWWATRDALAAAPQNWIVVGLVLAMFAIVPSCASDPPESWRPPSPAESAGGTGPASPFDRGGTQPWCT